MKQLLALLAAVVLVVAAVLARNALTDEDGDGTSGGRPLIVCIDELRDACEALDDVDLQFEDAGDTLERLVEGDFEFDGWITLDPWPDVANAAASQAALETGDAIASTPLILVGFEPATGELPCATEVTWRCLFEADASAAIPPRDTALGLLLLGNAASGWYQRTDFASNDFRDDPDFQSWFADLAYDRDPLARLVLLRQAAGAFATAVGATGVAFSTVEDTPGAADLRSFTPEPSAKANVVLATSSGRGRGIDATPLARTLLEQGWELPSASSNHPDPGVLLALMEL